ncbi:hypothetical protein SAMN06269117_11446 [Balnearium lithotrophicum]|uniref:Uncharacterized protein n=1 Tax=Balnearium lithotrophicum TaxID=223788 RepID=A0A521CSC8_9BACT|nr:hypothetical protein [Balnearium lithotrophicum]SMO61550.1 hypothetical protein SAMN06269117_11446 [Balnearium lithotrophicum]
MDCLISEKTLIVGIDPGKKGGVAFIPFLPSAEGKSVEVFPMPDTSTLADLLFERRGEIYRCFVEKQHPYPKQGAVSSGNLMKHYGQILGILIALHIPFEEVPPQRWQAFIHGSKHKKRPRKEKKKKSIEKAKQMFPGVQIKSDGPAEALLIAEYGRKCLFGGL